MMEDTQLPVGQNRFALLIGNQSYDSSVGALKNPHNDIELVAEALTKQQSGALNRCASSLPSA